MEGILWMVRPPASFPGSSLDCQSCWAIPCCPAQLGGRSHSGAFVQNGLCEVFFASLRFRRLAGKHVFPIFHILRTPSRMDVAPARQENRLSLAKSGRSPEQPVSLTTCLYSQGRMFWPFGAFSPVSECSVVFWAQQPSSERLPALS